MNKGILTINEDGSQTMRGPITMERPKESQFYYDVHGGTFLNRRKFNEALSLYDKHIAGLPNFPASNFPKEDNGKVVGYREQKQTHVEVNVDIGSKWEDASDNEYEFTEDAYRRIIAIPAVKSTGEGKEDEPLTEKGEGGHEWLTHIKQFEKLYESWQSINPVTRLWWAQQIDIFAGKHPSDSTFPNEQLIPPSNMEDDFVHRVITISNDQINEEIDKIRSRLKMRLASASTDVVTEEDVINMHTNCRVNGKPATLKEVNPEMYNAILSIMSEWGTRCILDHIHETEEHGGLLPVKCSDRQPTEKGRYFVLGKFHPDDRITRGCVVWDKFWHVGTFSEIIEWYE